MLNAPRNVIRTSAHIAAPVDMAVNGSRRIHSIEALFATRQTVAVSSSLRPKLVRHCGIGTLQYDVCTPAHASTPDAYLIVLNTGSTIRTNANAVPSQP